MPGFPGAPNLVESVEQHCRGYLELLWGGGGGKQISLGRECHNFGVKAERALSWVATHLVSDGGTPEGEPPKMAEVAR